MSDLSITVANCVNINAPTRTKIATETITQGQPVYLASASTVGKADNNAAGKTTVEGIALNPCTAGQPCTYAYGTGGTYSITLGVTSTAGLDHYLSSNAGGICPVGDVTSGMRKFRVGYFSTTTTFQLDLKDYGVTL